MTVRDSMPRIHLKMQDAKTIEGGYYKPDVDENGILRWTPSKEHMPELPESNIKGEPGYTPIKGVDYFDGAPGKDGTDANVTVENITRALGYTPADEGDVNQLKGDLVDKLPKSPTGWPDWTADEQAAARERMGIDNQFVRVFQQTNMDWNEETSLIVDLNDLSHLIICILIEGADSYVSEFGLVSLTGKNGDFYYGVFELGNATGPNITAFCRYDINDMPKMTKFSGTGGNPNFTIRGSYSKGIANGSKNLPNYKVKKVHLPPMKGTVSISILGC